MKGKNSVLLKTDPTAKKRINELKFKAQAEEGMKITDQEITRRMVKTEGFNSLEREILNDAKQKKLLRGLR